VSSETGFGSGSDLEVAGFVLDGFEEAGLAVNVITCDGFELRSERDSEDEAAIAGAFVRGVVFVGVTSLLDPGSIKCFACSMPVSKTKVNQGKIDMDVSHPRLHYHT
jgi:hypothetical protein